MYKKHWDILDVYIPRSFLVSEEDSISSYGSTAEDLNIDDISSAVPTSTVVGSTDHSAVYQSTTEVEPEVEEIFDTCEISKKAAALFILKAKHVHKVAQSRLNGMMGDISNLLESKVYDLESKVMAVLNFHDADPALKLEVNKIFHSTDWSDPFFGLASQFLHQKFLKAKLCLVVSSSNLTLLI